MKINLISPKQFRDMLNGSLDIPISMNKIYPMVRAQDFPSIKIGGNYYVLKDKVAEWIEGQTKKDEDIY